MNVIIDPAVKAKFKTYPKTIGKKLKYLRQVIIETASEIKEIDELEETLKWGEPSYLVKKGSTIRIDWKKSKPDQYAIYFKCTSKLVGTFKEVYGDKFNYERNRAILFKIEENIPELELRHCISLALTYHRVKHLPMLGVLN